MNPKNIIIGKTNKIIEEYFLSKKFRKQLKNDNFSIITNNCFGGIAYHILGKKFLSPTINLYIDPSEFVLFCSNLDFFLKQNLKQIKSNLNFPVGILGENGVKLYFMHYNSFEEAKEKWEIRKRRINFNNLFFVLTERIVTTIPPKRCDEKTIHDFCSLPFKNKVFFSSKPFNNKSVYFFKDFEKKGLVDTITSYKGISGKRNFSRNGFDFVRFLNEGCYW